MNANSPATNSQMVRRLDVTICPTRPNTETCPTVPLTIEVPNGSTPSLNVPSGTAIVRNISTSGAGAQEGSSYRWQDVLGDISLSEFPDVINSGPNYNDVINFVDRQASEIGSPPGQTRDTQEGTSKPKPGTSRTESGKRSGTNTNEHFFQFILMAPTSAAVPIHQESLTYLNQGQSIEIKCKRLGASGENFQILRSVVSICFHNRRQLFDEQKLMDEWRGLHSGLKPIDVDLPLSVNVFQVKCSGNAIEFCWDPSRNTSIFIKVNILSTDFTVKKHGGEKGVPFRLSLSTFSHGDKDVVQMHAAYAQIRVFKLKGADRKNKTDREKAEKRVDRERFQPAYDYTILTETFPTDVNDLDALLEQPTDSVNVTQNTSNVESDNASHRSGASHDSAEASDDFIPFSSLPNDATDTETCVWLKRQRFGSYINVFNGYSAVDILRLTYGDLVKLCKVETDALRLHNALHAKRIDPKNTVYIKLPTEKDEAIYTPVYLNDLTLEEMRSKLAQLLSLDVENISSLQCHISSDVRTRVTDDFVRYLNNGASFKLEISKLDDQETDCENVIVVLRRTDVS